jgi:hypothetical protein
MCTVASDFSTLCGTKQVIEAVARSWEDLYTVRRSDYAFHLKTAPLEQLHESLHDPRSPAVARIWHEKGAPPGGIKQLQAELLAHGLPAVCEPGHHFSLAGGGGPSAGGGLGVTISQQTALSAKAAGLTLAQIATGNRVAVLDTGDTSGTRSTMVDMIGGACNAIALAKDLDGHGTAVTMLIKTIRPAADVYAVRVVDGSLSSSYELLCGLAYALWSDEFDVVNVSLAAKMSPGCATTLGGSLDLVLELCRQRGTPLPRLVAAAGNTGHSFGYPAQLPTAIVVQANDWLGNPAAYNIAVPTNVTPVFASGGDANMPFGKMPSGPIYGTSFAAAVVTAHLI